MDEEFEGIINQEETADKELPEFESISDVLAHYWPLFYPGSIYIQGVVIVEAAYPQGRILRHITDGTEWSVLGMLECLKMQIQATNVDEIVNAGYTVSPADDEDDEDSEDE